MKKKILIIVLSVVFVACLALGAVFCLKHIGSKEKGGGLIQKVYLSPNSITMDAGDTKKISVYNPNNYTITWSSANDTIATVTQEGLVSAISQGVTIIKAHTANYTAECVVVVSGLNEVPVLTTSEENLAILLDDEFTLTASVNNKGEAQKATIEYSLDKNDIIEVTSNRDEDQKIYSFTIKGKSIGLVNLTLKTSFNGRELVKTIPVEVKDDVLFVFANNERLDESTMIPSIQLFASAPVSDENFQVDEDYAGLNEAEISIASVTISGNKVDNPNITWRTDNDEVVRVNNGRLEAVSNGSTYVYASYGEYEQTIIVNVALPKVVVKNLYFDVEKTGTIVELPNYMQGISAATIDGKDIFVSFDQSTGKLVYNPSELKLGDDKELMLSSKTALYCVRSSVVTKIIKTKADLDAFRTLSKEVYPNEEYKYGGYFILGANIEYNSIWPEFVSYGQLDNYICEILPTKGFVGIFDGRGYVINGMQTLYDTAFITTLGVGGIIRNVGFTNVINEGTVVTGLNGGTVENVFVSGVNASSKINTGFIADIVGGATINNCVLVVEDNKAGNLFGPIYSRLRNPEGCNFDNNVIIGYDSYRSTGGWTEQHVNCANNSKIYETLDEFVSEYDASFFAGWSDVWNMGRNGETPVLKNSTNKISNREIVLAGKSFVLSSSFNSTFELVSPVNGVVIEGNKVIVDSTIAGGTEFTIRATANIQCTLIGEKTFKVFATMDGEAVSMNKSIDIDRSIATDVYEIKLDESVFGGAELFSIEAEVIKNGIPGALVGDIVPVIADGLTNSVLSISKEELLTVPAGIYNLRIGIMQGDELKIYSYEVHLITKIVMTGEDFVRLSISDGGDFGQYSQEDRSRGYFVLGANVTWQEVKGITAFNTINGAAKFSGIFDGRGYNIDGFNTSSTFGSSGLFRDISGGIVRNVSFTNAIKGSGNGGLIANRVGGLAKDGSTDNAVAKPVGWYAELTNIFISGQFYEGFNGNEFNVYISMFIEYADSLGSVAPDNSIIIDNIVINLTKEPNVTTIPKGWGALLSLDSQYNWGNNMMKQFSNIYVLGTKWLGQEPNTEHSMVKEWMAKAVNVDAYDSADLEQVVGTKTLAEVIVENGNIWNYEDGKLTMKNDGESVSLN